MAYVPMTAGGGSMSETTLWTNQSPTAAFSANEVTLSDDINNYDYIKVEYKATKDTNDLYSTIIDIPTFKTFTQSSATGEGYICGLCVFKGSSWAFANMYRRIFAHQTDTTVYFSGGGTYGNTTANNNYIIPTRIFGLK